MRCAMTDIERELKRQTLMMAENRANEAFYAGLFAGFLIVMFGPMIIPEWLSTLIWQSVPWWGYFAFPFVFGGICAWISYRQMVDD